MCRARWQWLHASGTHSAATPSAAAPSAAAPSAATPSAATPSAATQDGYYESNINVLLIIVKIVKTLR